MTRLEMNKQKEELDNEVIVLFKQGYIINDIAEMVDLSSGNVNVIIAAHKKMYGEIIREPIKKKEVYRTPSDETISTVGCKFAEDKRKIFKVVVDGKRYIDFTDMVMGL